MHSKTITELLTLPNFQVVSVRHDSSILNFFLRRITSAIPEGGNNKIKRLKRMAYGYKDVACFLRTNSDQRIRRGFFPQPGSRMRCGSGCQERMIWAMTSSCRSAAEIAPRTPLRNAAAGSLVCRLLRVFIRLPRVDDSSGFAAQDSFACQHQKIGQAGQHDDGRAAGQVVAVAHGQAAADEGHGAEGGEHHHLA